MKHYSVSSLIRKKRDNIILSEDEIQFLINQYNEDAIPDYQMSAFLMATYFNELSDSETSAFTNAMLYSGKVIDLKDIQGTKIDKHSTGGVGDKVSLILGPIVASCGVPVPMIAGRGLGHTGGTIDKLESIPGFNVNLNLDEFKSLLALNNLVIIGQTEEIAPADKRLYALRDVTSTVESIPLIASSIMCKKLAEGIDGLVLDVKVGNGAFMKNEAAAKRLAEKMISIGNSFGKEVIAYLTSMDQPLGNKIGNWLEVEESIACLKDEGPADIMEVTHQLAGAMIYLGKKADSINEGIELSQAAVKSGHAYQKFIKFIRSQGGNVEFFDHPEKYRKAQFSFELISSRDGFINKIDAYKFGLAAVKLGAGREKKEDSVDHHSGIVLNKKVGEAVKKGETIASCFTNKLDIELEVLENLHDAIRITEAKPEIKPLILSVLASSNYW